VSKRHFADLASGQGEHEQPDRVEETAARIADVHPERGLAVGSCRDDSVAPLSLRADCGEEAAGEFASGVLERERGHRQAHVFAEQCDDRFNVAVRERMRDLLDELLLGG
jgi:hypothetical protein